MVALTFSQAPHCLSTSNARRDAAGPSWLTACCGVCSSHPTCLQSWDTTAGTGSFPVMLTCSSSLPAAPPAAPPAALKPQLTWLHLPEPGHMETESQFRRREPKKAPGLCRSSHLPPLSHTCPCAGIPEHPPMGTMSRCRDTSGREASGTSQAGDEQLQHVHRQHRILPAAKEENPPAMWYQAQQHELPSPHPSRADGTSRGSAAFAGRIFRWQLRSVSIVPLTAVAPSSSSRSS